MKKILTKIGLHNWKIIKIEYEVPSSRYHNVYFDVYTKKCKWCDKQKKILRPYTAVKCKVQLNSVLMMDSLEYKCYL